MVSTETLLYNQSGGQHVVVLLLLANQQSVDWTGKLLQSSLLAGHGIISVCSHAKCVCVMAGLQSQPASLVRSRGGQGSLTAELGFLNGETPSNSAREKIYGMQEGRYHSKRRASVARPGSRASQVGW